MPTEQQLQQQQLAVLPPLDASAADQLLALTLPADAEGTVVNPQSASAAGFSTRLHPDGSKITGGSSGGHTLSSLHTLDSSLPTPSSSSPLLAHPSVTDAWFGSVRATPGVNTDYVITAAPSTRVLRIVVLVNRETFTQRSDVLTIRHGRSTTTGGSGASSNPTSATDSGADDAHVLQGDAVALPIYNLCAQSSAANGTSTGVGSALPSAAAADAASLLLSSAVQGAPLQSSAAYVSSVRAALSSFCSVSVWTVDLYSSSATLNFRSNSVSGAYFVSSWTTSAHCPEGLEPAPDGSTCMRRYEMDERVQIAALVVAAAMAAALLLIAALFIWQRDTVVVRASALTLQLCLLMCLFGMCVGAALYTVPPADPSAHSVCFARAWLTLLPLCAMLAALFARTAHITAVFTSQGLRAEKPMYHLLRWLAVAVAAQLALLITLTALPLTEARLSQQSGLPGQLILECRGRSGFWPWLGVQIGFLLLLLLPSVRVAWRARKLPIKFNEAVSPPRTACTHRHSGTARGTEEWTAAYMYAVCASVLPLLCALFVCSVEFVQHAGCERSVFFDGRSRGHWRQWNGTARSRTGSCCLWTTDARGIMDGNTHGTKDHATAQGT
jgi:hypothetical protein